MADTAAKPERNRSRSPGRSRSLSPRRNRNDRSPRSTGGCRVVVRNIPYEIRWQELKDTFRKEIGDVTFVKMLENPDGKSKGVALVEFRDPEHARRAIDEFHQKKMHDRNIIVREEREKDRQEFMANDMNFRDGGGPGMGPGNMGPGNMGHGNMGGGGGGMGGMSPASLGVSPQVLQQLGIEPPITNTVFVANLDYRVTWWKLKDVFKLAGNVINAEIKEDKSGKSRGMGVINFEHPMEAVQAVSMFNGQVLYDRNMIVRVDKGHEPDKPKLPIGLKSIGMGLGSGGSPLTNFNQMGSNGNFGLSDPYMKQDMGLGGGSGLLGMGGLGGSQGLGLLGSGMGGGNDMGFGLGAGLGGLGGNLGGMGLGLGGSGSMNSGVMGGMGMGGGMSDLGLSGLGGSKMGMSDNFPNSYSGSNYNGSGSISGLGGLGPNLNSLSAGLGMGGSGDRMGMSGMDRLGMGDGMGRDRMGSLGDRMIGMDKGRDGYGGRMDMRDVYGGRMDMRDMRDDGRRNTTRPSNSIIMVKNLPYSTTWQELKEHFREAGDVKFAEIVMENGRSTGVGYVRFNSDGDAQRAISLKNRSRIERRNIDVSLQRN